MTDRSRSDRESSASELIGGWDPMAGSASASRATDEAIGPDLLDWPPQDAEVNDATRSETRRFSDFSLHLFTNEDDLERSRHSISPPNPTREASRTSRDPIRFPRPGEMLAGFRIISELGRGAFARVYLAEQVELADRLVALKVSRALGDEPRALARLQHAHIVPIHSVHDDRSTGLRLLCMPYLGGANLAQVLETAGARAPTQATGRSLIAALDRVSGRLSALPAPVGSKVSTAVLPRSTGAELSGPLDSDSHPETGGARDRSPTAVRSLLGRYLARLPWWREFIAEPPGTLEDEVDSLQPARRYLRSHSFVQAAVWIAARLAEALEHAHARGLLHRDLKPSNILIADDGTPMILDFNLSAEIVGPQPEDAPKAMVGGTLPYMAPEHLDAFNPEGSTRPEAVDERSDLYSLGLILFEMLAGHHPYPDPAAGLPLVEVLRRMTEERWRAVPSVRESNPMVPLSLDALLKKCIDPDPARRYQRAHDLAEDLRRFLDDLPMAHCPEPSLIERAAKWFRRHPEARGSSTVGLVAGVLLLGIVSVAGAIAVRLEGASAILKRERFNDVFRECQLLLNTSSGPVSHLERGVGLASRALASYQLDQPGEWAKNPMVRRLPADQRQTLVEELSELMLLHARAQVELARRRSEPWRRWALQSGITWLDRAEAIDPHPSAALFQERARYYKALGLSHEAALDRARAERIQPATARDFYLLGTTMAGQGQIDQAENYLSRAIALDPKRFWAWFALGLCHYDQGRYDIAAHDFTVCTVLAPTFAWPHMNRGIALAASNRLVEARAAYDQALRANPNFLEALVNRALCSLELGQAEEAAADLDRAMSLGRLEEGILAAWAEAQSRLGRRSLAEAEFEAVLRKRPDDPMILVAHGFFLIRHDPIRAENEFRRALSIDPRHPRAHLGLAHVKRHGAPREALAHLDQALDALPGLTDARVLRALTRARLGDPDAVADVEILVRTPIPINLYNASCAMAILSRTTRDDRIALKAIDLLRRALDAGFPIDHARTDPDLKPLHGTRGFQELLNMHIK